jgi:hypothetical protein
MSSEPIGAECDKVCGDDGNVYILRQQTSTPDETWGLGFISPDERGTLTHGKPRLLGPELQCEAFQDGLFDCYFRALLSLTRQMLNARVQHLPDCLKKLDA